MQPKDAIPATRDFPLYLEFLPWLWSHRLFVIYSPIAVWRARLPEGDTTRNEVLRPMKRPLLFAIMAVVAVFALAFAFAVATSPALAAPAYQEARPVIVQPAPDAAVRDVVQIIGTAVHPQL
jgi:hypothetical protein